MPTCPRLLSIFATTLLATTVSVAHADTFDIFHVTGPGYDLRFGLLASPTPSSYNFDRFEVDHITYTLNASPALRANFIFFNIGNDESYTFGVGTTGYGARATSPFFTGTTAMPTFLTGTFTLSGYGLYGKPGSGRLLLTITPVTTPSAVPEPSTLALLGTGILGMASIAGRSFFRS